MEPGGRGELDELGGRPPRPLKGEFKRFAIMSCALR